MTSLFDWLVQNEPSFRKSRIPSLYSDLTQQKTTNPDGFSGNVLAWQSALKHAALAGQLPTSTQSNTFVLETSDQLLDSLASPAYGRPSGLGAVFDTCIQTSKMLDVSEFKKLDHSIYSRSWLRIPDPWSVLKWGLRQTGLVSSGSYDLSGRLRTGRLVLVEALEEVSKQVAAIQEQEVGGSLTDRVMTREDFVTLLQQQAKTKVTLANEDLNILLQYLARDKQMLVYNSDTIKFKSPSMSSSATKGTESLTQEDATIASMKSLMRRLESQISSLNTRIGTLQNNAQVAVKSGNKSSALSALRSKKLAERNLQQRNDTLHQLEEVYTKIEQAIDQVAIVQVMESSVGVLKGLNERIGPADRIEDVVDALREEMGKVDEVGQILQEPLDEGKTVVDEAEVDDELAAMEREEATKERERESELTRQRLQELDDVELRRKVAETRERSSTKEGDAQVDKVMNRLSGMSIEEDKNGDRNASDSEKEGERIAQAAS